MTKMPQFTTNSHQSSTSFTEKTIKII